MFDDLDRKAVEAGARALRETPVYRDYDAYRETDYRKLARAVLLAASEVIDCPRCVTERVGDVVRRRAIPCKLCGGSGFLRVLLRGEPE